jgi:RNase P/RNase MRP subunit p29
MTPNCLNVLSRGIVGLEAKILESSDSTLRGIVGTIVFETKNTILIRKKDSLVRQVAKKGSKKTTTSDRFLRLLYKWFCIDRKT